MKNAEPSYKRLIIGTFFAYFFAMLILFSGIDFVKAAISKNSSYELKYEQEETTDNGQMVYRLYIDGELYGDADYELYSLLDKNGNTDYRWCFLIERAKELSYAVILALMILFVIIITTSTKGKTPFTPQNIKRIRIIGFLQLNLAFVPGLVVFVMKIIKFQYVSLRSSISWVYMLLIGFIILMLAQVFEYGVRLQEDNDLIA